MFSPRRDAGRSALQDEERALYAAVVAVEAQLSAGNGVGAFYAASEALAAPVDAFFEKVFVMAEDAGVRANRLALLRRVATLPDGVLDLAELPGF